RAALAAHAGPARRRGGLGAAAATSTALGLAVPVSVAVPGVAAARARRGALPARGKRRHGAHRHLAIAERHAPVLVDVASLRRPDRGRVAHRLRAFRVETFANELGGVDVLGAGDDEVAATRV